MSHGSAFELGRECRVQVRLHAVVVTADLSLDLW
jgi:hypothetical protein